VKDSFTDYLLCVLSDECVAGHNEGIITKIVTRGSCDSHEHEVRPLEVVCAVLSNLYVQVLIHCECIIIG